MGRRKRKFNRSLDRAARGLGLPRYFELFERTRFVLAGSSVLWLFKESLRGGGYVRYTLFGRAIKLVRGVKPVLNPEYGKAWLYAKFSFHPYTGETRVYIEDILAYPRSIHVGSYMMNVFIRFLRDWDRFFFVKEVYGELSVVDERDPLNRVRRDAFFRGFGFRIEEEGTKEKLGRYVKAGIEDLREKELPDVLEFSPEDVFLYLGERLALWNFLGEGNE